MTNNAVNPMVYIYSNANIQQFIVLRCVPKFIAKKTSLYKDYTSKQQRSMIFNRIASTACKASSLSSSTAAKEAKQIYINQDQVQIKQSISNHEA